MSTITPTIVQVSNYTPYDGWKVTWAGIGDSDTCTGVNLSNYSDCSIQVTGTFASASIACQGSNNSTTGSDGNWFSKTNPAGTTIAITAAGGSQVTEASVWTRPSSASGSGSSTTVTMFFRTSLPVR